jgi:hypothetical protein
MTAFSPPGAMNSFVSTTREFPRDESLIETLEHTYTEVAQAVNFREIGTYAYAEVVTGKSYQDPNDANIVSLSFRQIYTIPAISQGTTAIIAHGIPSTFFPTLIIGTCSTDRPDFRPLPYVGPWGTDLIAVRVDATNIYVINGAGGPNIVSGILTLEYLYT